jgi:hypothetical protein
MQSEFEMSLVGEVTYFLGQANGKHYLHFPKHVCQEHNKEAWIGKWKPQEDTCCNTFEVKIKR